MNEVWQFLKPTTIVAIIADLNEAIPGDPSHVTALWNVNLATQALVNLVGADDAGAMIREAMGDHHDK